MTPTYDVTLTSDELVLILDALDTVDPAIFHSRIDSTTATKRLALRLRLDLIEGRTKATLVPDKHDVPLVLTPDEQAAAGKDFDDFDPGKCSSCGTGLILGEEDRCDDCKEDEDEDDGEDYGTCPDCGEVQKGDERYQRTDGLLVCQHCI